MDIEDRDIEDRDIDGWRMELAPGLAAGILAAAAQAYPRECCGLLEGRRDGNLFRVLTLHPSPNLAERSDRFLIDPAIQFAARRQARARGHALIGCYHSHPGGRAEPSVHDRTGAEEEGFLWLIVADRTLNGFVYLDGGFGRAMGADWVTSSE